MLPHDLIEALKDHSDLSSLLPPPSLRSSRLLYLPLHCMLNVNSWAMAPTDHDVRLLQTSCLLHRTVKGEQLAAEESVLMVHHVRQALQRANKLTMSLSEQEQRVVELMRTWLQAFHIPHNQQQQREEILTNDSCPVCHDGIAVLEMLKI